MIFLYIYQRTELHLHLIQFWFKCNSSWLNQEQKNRKHFITRYEELEVSTTSKCQRPWTQYYLEERAIQTFKFCFISIYQAMSILNMVQKSWINPKLSTDNQIFGNFDFNGTPMAPLGTKPFIYKIQKQKALGQTMEEKDGTSDRHLSTTKITTYLLPLH